MASACLVSTSSVSASTISLLHGPGAVERGVIRHRHVLEHLRVPTNGGGEFGDGGPTPPGLQDEPRGGLETIPRGGVIPEDDVLGLLPAEQRSPTQHLSSTYRSPTCVSITLMSCSSMVFRNPRLAMTVGHHGVLHQLTRPLVREGSRRKDLVAVDDVSIRIRQDGPIGPRRGPLRLRRRISGRPR